MSLEVEGRRVAALRARAHPLRLRMLSLLTGAAMSAAELGRELGVSQALASYHLRQLAHAEVAELWVDPDDWAEARTAIREAAALLHERARRPHEPGTVHVNTSLVMFVMT